MIKKPTSSQTLFMHTFGEKKVVASMRTKKWIDSSNVAAKECLQDIGIWR